MLRRHFHRLLGAGLTASALAPFLRYPSSPALTKPKRLQPGDTVGFITPGSYAPDESLQKAWNNIESLGLKVKPGKNLRALRGFNAGTDAQRLEDIHLMFADPEVKAIWCVRGGYGCTRLLPFLDFNLIRQNPKIFIGYSDITALLQAIHLNTGLVCFHGPVAASNFTDYNMAELENLLFQVPSSHTILLAEGQKGKTAPEYQPSVIQAGRASGILCGGNLSLMAAMAGTPHAFDLSGKLVFIEEVEERPYRVDRMLTTLLQASYLDKAAGVALGVFAACQPKPDERSLSLMETLQDRLGGLGMPVVYGLSFGHVADNCTLPFGIPATLDTSNLSLQLEDSAVV